MTHERRSFTINTGLVNESLRREAAARKRQDTIYSGRIGNLSLQAKVVVPIVVVGGVGLLTGCAFNLNKSYPGVEKLGATPTPGGVSGATNESHSVFSNFPGSDTCKDFSGKEFAVGRGDPNDVTLYQCLVGGNEEEWSEWELNGAKKDTIAIAHWKDGKLVGRDVFQAADSTDTAKRTVGKEKITLARGEDGHLKITPPASFNEVPASSSPVSPDPTESPSPINEATPSAEVPTVIGNPTGTPEGVNMDSHTLATAEAASGGSLATKLPETNTSPVIIGGGLTGAVALIGLAIFGKIKFDQFIARRKAAIAEATKKEKARRDKIVKEYHVYPD